MLEVESRLFHFRLRDGRVGFVRVRLEARKRAHERASLLTPVAKAFSTDIGSEVASLGIQVHGGMGYVEETGAAQHYRDARITAIDWSGGGVRVASAYVPNGRALDNDHGSHVHFRE